MAAASFIVAIGRNYSEHIKELGNTAPKEPFFFLKPTTSYVLSGGKVEIPSGIIAHHEVELGVVIGKGGRDISQANAESHVAGYALADQVKKRGLPWSAAKGFDTFTPIGSFIPKDQISDPHALRLSLKHSLCRIAGTLKLRLTYISHPSFSGIAHTCFR
ncbi:hypothetical protein C8J57DRAFT_1287845 [Mycena rebaudengoi]|nr:hypothetical protein C8J57DRAFT_1287845 [Mycena rebaudengoi]